MTSFIFLFKHYWEIRLDTVEIYVSAKLFIVLINCIYSFTSYQLLIIKLKKKKKKKKKFFFKI